MVASLLSALRYKGWWSCIGYWGHAYTYVSIVLQVGPRSSLARRSLKTAKQVAVVDTSNSSHQDRTPSMTICSPPATQRGVGQLKKPMSTQWQLEQASVITMRYIFRGWRWLRMRRSACAYSRPQQNLEQLASSRLMCGATPGTVTFTEGSHRLRRPQEERRARPARSIGWLNQPGSYGNGKSIAGS